MPRQRFQDPTIQQGKNGSYFIRPWVDVITAEGLERQKRTLVLGPASMGKRAAIAKKNELMETINHADYVIRSQIPFSEMLDNFLRGHAAKVGYVARCKYELLIKNHVRPTFGTSSMAEVTTQRIQTWLDQKKLSWSTKTDLRNLLSGIFSRAIEWGLYKDNNPVRFVHVGRRTLVLEKRKLTDDQTRRFLAAQPYDLRVMCCTGQSAHTRSESWAALREEFSD